MRRLASRVLGPASVFLFVSSEIILSYLNGLSSLEMLKLGHPGGPDWTPPPLPRSPPRIAHTRPLRAAAAAANVRNGAAPAGRARGLLAP